MKRKTEGASGMEPSEKKGGDPFPWSLETGNDDDKMVIAFFITDWKQIAPPPSIVARVKQCLQAAVDAGYYDHLKRTTGTRMVALDQLSDFKFINIKVTRFSSKTRIDCVITDQSTKTTTDLLLARALPQSLLPELIIQYVKPETFMASVDDGKKLWMEDYTNLFSNTGLAFRFPKINTMHPVDSMLLHADLKPGTVLVGNNDFVEFEGVGFFDVLRVDRKLCPTMEDLKKSFPEISSEMVKNLPWTQLNHKGDFVPIEKGILKDLVPVIIRALYTQRTPPDKLEEDNSEYDAKFLVDARVYVRFINVQKAAPWKTAAGMQMLAAHPIFKRNLFSKLLYDMDDPLAIRAKENVSNLASFISSKYPSQ
jgi:hypothetical protein